MSEEFSISFDQRSLSEIAQLQGFDVLLAPETQEAMGKGGDLLVDASVANTWARFQKPSGYLASTLHKIVTSPYEIQIGSDAPHAHRREFSFKGPDSLGRYFPNDPSAFYMTDAMNDNAQDVLKLIDNGVENALGRLGR
jgi:hypothetical protein